MPDLTFQVFWHLLVLNLGTLIIPQSICIAAAVYVALRRAHRRNSDQDELAAFRKAKAESGRSEPLRRSQSVPEN
jgi:hypothetical protein